MTHYALYLAIILYGLLSSPTPDSPSWVEFTIIGLIVISLGITRPIYALTARGFPITLSYHRLFFVLMVTTPLAIGLINGYELTNVIRDIIPIIALILPLCFYRNALDALPVIMALAGGLFALRYIAPVIPPLNFLAGDTSLLYLANSPLIPFAAILGFAWLSDIRNNFLTKRLLGILLLVACFGAMAMTLQRAPIILTATACLIILGIRSVHKPIQSMVIGAIVMACLAPLLPLIMDVGQSLSAKNMAVGFNNRIEEFQTVMAQSTWFGHGWGSEIQSPAVGDIWVRFTHNMVSYYWLKSGIIGAIASIIFIILWAWQNIKLIRINPAIGLAVFVPFIIHVTLYTGFKTLDFALLLTLLSSLCVPKESLSLTEPSPQPSARQDA